MQNQWWQRKWALGLGGIGGLLIILLPLLGTIIWPIYRPASYPIAILLAQDADFGLAFRNMYLVGFALILLMLVALQLLYRYEASLKLQHSVAWLFGGLAILTLFGYLMPLQNMADLAVSKVTWSLRDVLALIVNLLLAWTLWRFSKALANHKLFSPANVLRLMTILFLLFNALEYGMALLGWPLSGLMDLLSYDSLALAFIYLSWYYMRQAE
ncbi:hypothetical protein WOSG25_020670 [Weissella oryzae SG25]|uniref:Integral membrane protein n=1 Tax=Weissella oryzae (strain DSM 25784 / JCM 18191 / LMG 30913 / SG25) TaxID=1329250 RepID=A0A069CRC9_WEIOS|nr:hypothetical protein [Weissella oryzae]GAK30270.1 hypothetical protein WOSG25_020670 [Weissella oryzae SG25]